MEQAFFLTVGDLQIACRQTAPECGDIRRLVLSVHGIGGSMEDDIQRSIAEEMELFGSAVYRFDLPGHGQSTPGENRLSLTECQEALLAVARHARCAYEYVEDLCIFATGFGAYVTLSCLEELLALPGNVRLVLQTPSVRMHATLLAMRDISRETLWALDTIPFPTPRPLTISYRFYEELEQNTVLTTHPIPMLILHGEEDDFIPMNDILQFRRINEKSRLVIIPGTSHRFQEDGAWDMVLDLTRDWFEFEQVLCCDWE